MLLVVVRSLLWQLIGRDDEELFCALYPAHMKLEQILVARLDAGDWIAPGPFTIAKIEERVVKGDYPYDYWFERGFGLEIRDREEGSRLCLMP